MMMLAHADYCVWHHFCDLPPYAKREKKQSEMLHTFLLLPMAGIEPGPPPQQVGVLSISPLPHGFMFKTFWCHIISLNYTFKQLGYFLALLFSLR